MIKKAIKYGFNQDKRSNGGWRSFSIFNLEQKIMLTRGYIIGKIIDDLSQLQGQINMRCHVGLTDLNKFSEDFIKDVINIAYNMGLKNLNLDRSNEAGFDLGDERKKQAFQVTSVPDSAKITKTLKAITSEHLKKYDKFGVIVLGKKQSTYDAVDKDLRKKYQFDINRDIIDLDDINRQIVSLKFDDLYKLHELFEKQFQKVIIEMEVPNSKGKYPTSLSDRLEITPNTICRNAIAFSKECKGYNLKEIQECFRKLAKLPRVTRECLKIIIEIGEREDEGFKVDYREFDRKLHIPDRERKEEVDILDKRQFVWKPDPPEDTDIRTRFGILMFEIICYAIEKNCLEKLLVALDFTILDEEEKIT
jgi:hypothetical protein